MIHFGNRNLIVFLKDKETVMFSFLAEFIIVGLYILFIRDNLLESFSGMKDAQLILDAWMIAGILAITSVTTTMGAFAVMVEDKEKNVCQDFMISPVNKFYFLGGYLYSAVIIGLIMTTFILILSELYILIKYKVALLVGRFLACYIIVIITTISNSCLVLFFVSFIKSTKALASCCTIIGTLIGFLTGIYIPMGNLPDIVQTIVKGFPVSHAVVLFRQVLMNPLIEDSLGDQPQAVIDKFKDIMGVQYKMRNSIMPASGSIAILLISACVFLLVTVWVFSKRKFK